jgi:glycosyltransferase involved in cell wall biosynthesis
MRIAQISPLIESVPPKGYGGTERIVSYITEELVRRGHDVTLFASGDSATAARLIASSPISIRQELSEQNPLIDPLIWSYIQLDDVLQFQNEFDILHFHTDFLHFPFSRQSNYAHVTTLHGRLDLAGLDLLYDRYSDIPLVSISDDQRQPVKNARWISTVYHGIPANQYKQGDGKGNYLAFLGRISTEKRVDRAIEIAKQTGMKIKIAAKIDRADKTYFEQIKHLFSDEHVEFVGELKEPEKEKFLGNALALLFPIDWPEPFGLVMIESMACGTPVIAFNNGSVPEIIDTGKTGFVVSSIDEAVKAVNNIHLISRDECRKKFEERFRTEVMVDQYEKIYQTMISENIQKAKRHQATF